MTVANFFQGHPKSRQLFDAIAGQIATMGTTALRVSKSQIAFRRRRNVAVVWMPAQYLAGKTAPLVLTLSFAKRIPSRRWKEIAQVSPGRFTHHLELYKVADIDEEVSDWLRMAWEAAA